MQLCPEPVTDTFSSAFAALWELMVISGETMWFVIKRLPVLNKNTIYIGNVVSSTNSVKDITIRKNVIFCSCLMHFGGSNSFKFWACIIYKESNNWFAGFLILINLFAYVYIRISEFPFSEKETLHRKGGRKPRTSLWAAESVSKTKQNKTKHLLHLVWVADVRHEF